MTIEKQFYTLYSGMVKIASYHVDNESQLHHIMMHIMMNERVVIMINIYYLFLGDSKKSYRERSQANTDIQIWDRR